ncbi:MAG: hypothetical protein N2654_01835 [Deltaproteobacteria bacterium]|nr:hypothetical protein [Deltaproteobacteria bacterium]
MLFAISSISSFVIALLTFFAFLRNLTLFNPNILGLIFGFLGFLGALSVQGKLRVFYHEFKHKLVSGLVGNRPKKLEIKNALEGEFEYEYSTETKHYNPFIALAPYFFPFVTLFTTPFWTVFLGVEKVIKEAIFVFSLSFDLTFNTSEISPEQSDFDAVPGGKLTGLVFVISMNLIQTVLCLSVILGGFDFLTTILLDAFWTFPIEFFKNSFF